MLKVPAIGGTGADCALDLFFTRVITNMLIILLRYRILLPSLVSFILKLLQKLQLPTALTVVPIASLVPPRPLKSNGIVFGLLQELHYGYMIVFFLILLYFIESLVSYSDSESLPWLFDPGIDISFHDIFWVHLRSRVVGGSGACAPISFSR